MNFGRNTVVISSCPDGHPWKIGVQNHKEPSNQSLITLPTTDGVVATSGTYKQGFTLDGVRYHQMLDPETDRPVQNGLAFVIILTQNSFTAEAYEFISLKV